ncbi:MAG: zeta toxin family protein [Acidobacteriota bacterium]|nr:zeta toxin family protein [Acidobacteriota bacterium]
MDLPLDRRPVIVALAGPNGAGKSTFYRAHLEQAGLRFVNADVLSRELRIGPYEAAKVADSLRRELVKQRESFVFETVFSDPAGDKLAFLKDAAAAGYTVILCFIGISGPATSEQRVAMRVSQGGHDVPTDKLQTRFPRILANLRSALRELPHVWVFDNDDLRHPFRLVTVYANGQPVRSQKPTPQWLASVLD